LIPWAEVVAGFTSPDAELRIRPNPANVAVYARMLPEYEVFEARAREVEPSA
jgi:hypothetical protein